MNASPGIAPAMVADIQQKLAASGGNPGGGSLSVTSPSTLPAASAVMPSQPAVEPPDFSNPMGMNLFAPFGGNPPGGSAPGDSAVHDTLDKIGSGMEQDVQDWSEGKVPGVLGQILGPEGSKMLGGFDASEIQGFTNNLLAPKANSIFTAPDDVATEVSKALGSVAGITGGLGVTSVLTDGLADLARAPQALQGFIDSVPTLSKYLGPLLSSSAKSAAALGAYGQLNPQLGSDFSLRMEQLKNDVEVGAAWGPLGLLKGGPYNIGTILSVSAQAGAFWKLAKMQGADDPTALTWALAGGALGTIGSVNKMSKADADMIVRTHAETVIKNNGLDIKPGYTDTDIAVLRRQALINFHPDQPEYRSGQQLRSVNEALNTLEKVPQSDRSPQSIKSDLTLVKEELANLFGTKTQATPADMQDSAAQFAQKLGLPEGQDAGMSKAIVPVGGTVTLPDEAHFGGNAGKTFNLPAQDDLTAPGHADTAAAKLGDRITELRKQAVITTDSNRQMILNRRIGLLTDIRDGIAPPKKIVITDSSQIPETGKIRDMWERTNNFLKNSGTKLKTPEQLRALSHFRYQTTDATGHIIETEGKFDPRMFLDTLRSRNPTLVQQMETGRAAAVSDQEVREEQKDAETFKEMYPLKPGYLARARDMEGARAQESARNAEVAEASKKEAETNAEASERERQGIKSLAKRTGMSAKSLRAYVQRHGMSVKDIIDMKPSDLAKQLVLDEPPKEVVEKRIADTKYAKAEATRRVNIQKVQSTQGKEDVIAFQQVPREIADMPESEQGKQLISSEEAQNIVEQYFSPEEVGVNFAKNIVTPRGLDAFGKYTQGMITFVENPHSSTPSHEVVHAYLDLFTGAQEKQSILDEVKGGREMSNGDAEEELADSFVDYVKQGKSRGFLRQLFDRVVSFIKKLGSFKGLKDKLFEDIVNKARPQAAKAGSDIYFKEFAKGPFRGFSDLTTKLIDRLRGHSVVSEKFIREMTNAADLKQPERDLIREALDDYKAETGKDEVNVADFANQVKTELLPLRRVIPSSVRSDLQDYRYEGINLPTELRGPVSDYRENIYESPINTSASNIHFGDDSQNYFAHTRTEDLPADGVLTNPNDSDLSPQGNTRRVLEVQSDLFQKGAETLNENISNAEYDSGKEAGDEMRSKLDPYRNTWHERIIREEVKQAAKDGKDLLQFPSGETAMKIEGLGSTDVFVSGHGTTGLRPTTEADLKVGAMLERAGEGDAGNSAWIVTDVGENGKFKAVPKRFVDDITRTVNNDRAYSAEVKQSIIKDAIANTHLKESFDISGKIDTENPIYRFYQKQVRNYLIRRYGARDITDKQGVSWTQVHVQQKFATDAVEAFQTEDSARLAQLKRTRDSMASQGQDTSKIDERIAAMTPEPPKTPQQETQQPTPPPITSKPVDASQIGIRVPESQTRPETLKTPLRRLIDDVGKGNKIGDKAKEIVNAAIDFIEPAAPVIRNQGADEYADVMRAFHTPDRVAQEFDTKFNSLQKFFSKFSDEDLRNFNLTRGTPESPEAHDIQDKAEKNLVEGLKDPKLIESLKQVSDDTFKYATANGLDMNYFEDYFFGTYKDPAKVSSFIDYWRSTDRYTKEKSLPSVADAATFGLELKDQNPVANLKSEMQLVGQRVGLKVLKDKIYASEIQPAVDALNANNALREQGKAETVPVPPGTFAGDSSSLTPAQKKIWMPIHDPVFKGMKFDPKYARLVNKLLSTNEVNKNMFFRGFRQATMVVRQIKFFGSVFHMQNIAKGAVSNEIGGMFNPKGYKDFGKSFNTLDKSDPEYLNYLNLGGGHGYSLDSQAEQQMNKYLEKMGWGEDSGSRVMKMTKYVPISPAFTKWMFSEFIPALKFSKYQQEVAQTEFKLGRKMTDAEKIAVISRNQNFYGERNERLSGRGSGMTSALRLLFMAPGYGEGNFRALGRATAGDLRSVNFVMNSLITTLALATIGTYILTGKGRNPKTLDDLRDLFKIRTNMQDGNGDTIYFDLMTYDKDYWSIYGNMATGNAGEIPGTLAARFSGEIGAPMRILTDLSTLAEGNMIYDFKGDPIWHSTDSFAEKLGKFIVYEGTEILPISVTTGQGALQKGTSIGEALGSAVSGFRPTTSEGVKDVKKAGQDLFDMQDVKKQKQIELNKLNNENPTEAEAQARQFNLDQTAKLQQIMKENGVSQLSKTELDKYILTSLKQGKSPNGTTIGDYFGQ